MGYNNVFSKVNKTKNYIFEERQTKTMRRFCQMLMIQQAH